MKQKLIARLRRGMTACALSGSVLLGSVALLGAFAPAAHAQTLEPVVSFNGATQAFSFQNVTTNTDSTGESVPDLFPTLKSIVPGDRITQNITLSVQQIPSDQQVTIYLQAQSENDDYNALLESATLQVVHEGDEITQSLDQPVPLGVFDGAQTEETTVTLAIPLSAGNEVSGLSANIDWIFSAEYAPEPSPTPTRTPTITVKPTPPSSNQDSPKTGEAFFLWIWVMLGVSAMGSVAFLLQGVFVCRKSKQ